MHKIISFSIASLTLMSTSTFALECTSDKAKNIIISNNYIIKGKYEPFAENIKLEVSSSLFYKIGNEEPTNQSKEVIEYDQHGQFIQETYDSYDSLNELDYFSRITKTDFGWENRSEDITENSVSTIKYMTDEQGRITKKSRKEIYKNEPPNDSDYSVQSMNSKIYYTFNENNCITQSKSVNIDTDHNGRKNESVINMTYIYENGQLTGFKTNYNDTVDITFIFDDLKRLIKFEMDLNGEKNQSIEYLTFDKHNNYLTSKSNPSNYGDYHTVKRELTYFK